jgi:anthranilate synthase component 1
MQPLTLDEFRRFAKKAARIAVFREIPNTTFLTSIDSYQCLCKKYHDDGVLLENLSEYESARYSHMGFDSMTTLRVEQDEKYDNPLALLRNLQSQFTFSTRPEVANLINCAMGFMTYDIVRYFENIPDRHPINSDIPILLFHFYALSLTFNHQNQTVLISVIVTVSDNPDADYDKAQQIIDETIREIHSSKIHSNVATNTPITTKVKVDVSDMDFIDKIKKAKEYIIAGDAFQIVLSRCFTRDYTIPPLEIYKTLCQISPSPFMFYFPFGTSILLGASPERMISVIDRTIAINPIAGTRARYDEKIDENIIEDLLNDTKEIAEHMMLIDLARNDLGSVSEPGSVKISELLKVKLYSHVIHITSTVIGKLQNKYDAYDAITAAFPAGTLSGAPKIRAMEIIDELETSRRGAYGGAICRIDGTGNFDSCIAIRMAYCRGGVATIRTGAGIVHDSNPASEVEETHQKSAAMLQAIALAHGEHYDTHHR